MQGSWLELLGAALGGGASVKLLDILYQELRRRLDRSQATRSAVSGRFDPLLKVTDELVGKLLALAKDDFQSLQNIAMPEGAIENHDLLSTIHLLAAFWANIEVLRRDGRELLVARDAQEKRLKSFLDCLESRHVRLVDRMFQRAIGELMLEPKDNSYQLLKFVDFVKRIETEPEAKRWVAPLVHLLVRMQHTTERQIVLKFATILHALIDNLDPEHLVTRHRQSIANKLSQKTRRDLRYRTFKVYLKFLAAPEKYVEPLKPDTQQRKAVRKDFGPQSLGNGTSVAPPLFQQILRKTYDFLDRMSS